ncbi:MAG: nucleoside deaminase [Bacilli bacterium]|nr:nucleoside deaminase [Bacilli bacterium]
MKSIVEEILKEANKAYKKGEIPVGCAVVRNGKLISKAHNTKQRTHNCINHAEILAITKASKKQKDWRLDDCELYVTLEPCDMCMEVIRQSRIKQVYYLLESKFNNEKKKIITKNKINDVDKMCENYKRQLSAFFANKR